MKKDEKELLLKDLCARLPYGVKMQYADKIYNVVGCHFDKLIMLLPFMSNLEGHPIETCKPYLRPMDSMTEDENREYELVANRCICTSTGFIHIEAQVLIDWLNAHYFDYRGLIEKGLALPAPEGMYE